MCQNVARTEEYVGSTFFALKNERLTVPCSVINFLAVCNAPLALNGSFCRGFYFSDTNLTAKRML